jgi:tRNA G18 (ribose-2'-O)-methylase SpoU
MRADRFMPVFFGAAEDVLAEASRQGRCIVALEDIGDVSPWDIDLSGRVHFVVGGEARGVPDAILAACDAVVRIPVRGFLPSYNLQGAVAAVAAERLRQLAGNPA